MNHCVYSFLLLALSLIALGLLGVAFSTSWWIIPLEVNIPRENLLNTSHDTRIYSALLPITITRGLLSECIAYRNTKVLVSNSFDFREEPSAKEQIRLSNEQCSSNQMACRTGATLSNPLTRCLNHEKRCDRIIDCEDNSDEWDCDNATMSDCPAGYIKCSDGIYCYRKNEQTCDGFSNCFDNSDEKSCDEEKCNLNKHVYCPQEQKCARRKDSYRCDGIVDCEDNSDEESCQQCHSDTKAFSCDSKCLSLTQHCDGIVHCSDFRDEIHCFQHENVSSSKRSFYLNDRRCEEKRFNPFDIYAPKIDAAQLETYSNPNQRLFYLNLMHYFQFIFSWSVFIGLVFVVSSIISLFCFACGDQKCKNVPFYFYNLWILLACLCISFGLLSFVFIFMLKKHMQLDHETNSSFDIMLRERNPSLQNLEFFGLSFWLACGSAATTLIALFISCCVCCSIGSSRSDNKEYEIMHMHSY